MERGPLRGEVQRELLEAVGGHGAGRDVDHRGHGDAVVEVGVGLAVGLAEVLDAQHRVAVVGVEVEAPAALVVQRPGDPHRDRVLQPEQPPHDHRAVRPRARPRHDQPVPARRHRPPRRAVRRDALVDADGSTHEGAVSFVIAHATGVPAPPTGRPPRRPGPRRGPRGRRGARPPARPRRAGPARGPGVVAVIATARRSASARGTAACATMLRKSASAVAVLPAIAPPPASRATRSTTSTSRSSELVGAVGHARGGHRVGHGGHPVRARGPHGVLPQRGVHVQAVGDQLDGHAVVVEQRDDRTGLAVVQWGHGVEQVRGVPGARRRSPRGSARSRRRCARPRPPRPRRRPGGSASSAPARSGARVTIATTPGGQQLVQLGRVGVAQLRGVVRAAAGRGRARAPPGARPRSRRRRRARRARPPRGAARSGAAATRLASVVVVPWARWNATARSAPARRPRPGTPPRRRRARGRRRTRARARRSARRRRPAPEPSATIRSPVGLQPARPVDAGATSASADRITSGLRDLGQAARRVRVAAAVDGDVQREQLERQDLQQRRQLLRSARRQHHVRIASATAARTRRRRRRRRARPAAAAPGPSRARRSRRRPRPAPAPVGRSSRAARAAGRPRRTPAPRRRRSPSASARPRARSGRSSRARSSPSAGRSGSGTRARRSPRRVPARRRRGRAARRPRAPCPPPTRSSSWCSASSCAV